MSNMRHIDVFFEKLGKFRDSANTRSIMLQNTLKIASICREFHQSVNRILNIEGEHYNNTGVPFFAKRNWHKVGRFLGFPKLLFAP